MKNLLLIWLLITLATSSLFAQQVIQKGNKLYLPNTLVVKLKSGTSPNVLNKSLAQISVKSAVELYPSNGVLEKTNRNDILNGIYQVNYNSSDDPAELAAKIEKMPGISWAEPRLVRRICDSPNDSLFIGGKQDNLIQINAPEAWNITKGDKKIIIGIVDSGVDWGHPDLAANIYKEYGELIPGSDICGENGIPDNDPSEDLNEQNVYHGTHVAGIAGAVTGNKIGMASIGYDCSILPVKVSQKEFRDKDGNPFILYGPEGIKWAADHGAKVINCSWGGTEYSNYDQTIINYAISKGALVVAGQGNYASTEHFYPADYEGVLSVGWLETGVGVKTISPKANYGEKVKVFAPGSNIYSTWQRTTQSSDDVYNVKSGSSISTPLVSGLAALVWSKFPGYSPKQIQERIRVTSEYIDDYNGSSYKNLLGHGIINALRAVDENTKAVSVRAESISIVVSENNEADFDSGIEALLKIYFTNYLEKVDNITVRLTSRDSSVTIENGTFNTGSMNMMSTVSNKSNEFRIKIKRAIPDHHIIRFLLKYTDGRDYNDFQWEEIESPYSSFETLNNNLITLTITNKGTMGFNDFPHNNEGEGFKYNGSENLMHEGAFMYGISPAKVMNEARIFERQKQDFVSKTTIQSENEFNDPNLQEYSCDFSDSFAGTNSLGFTTYFKAYSYSKWPDNNYVMLRTYLYNNSNISNFTKLYVGYFIDWNFGNGFNSDTTYFDTINKIAIAYNTRNSTLPYTAMAPLSLDYGIGFYAINNKGLFGPVQIADANGFSDTEKWYALSNGEKQISAGVGDISYIISGGPYYTPFHEYIKVDFAIAAGATLQDAVDAIKQCRTKFGYISGAGSVPATFSLDQNYPNPFNPTTTISYYLRSDRLVTLKVYDVLGREVAILVNKFQIAGNHYVQLSANKLHLSNGVYFYRLFGSDFSLVKKMILLK